jgi:surface polysaccharide O-acyltransferase-like enzyme
MSRFSSTTSDAASGPFFPPPTTYSERLGGIKYAASFGVVGIHCAGWVEEHALCNASEPNFAWIYAALRWSVPVFVMVSGTLLLYSQRDEELGPFLIRRFSWLAPIMVFWIVIYSILRLATNPDHTIHSQLLAALTGRPFLHLWYLYLLPGLYLVAIPLRLYLRAALPRDRWILFSGLALLLWLNIGLGLLLAPGTLAPWPFWFWGYLPYFVLGFLLATVRSATLGLCFYAVGVFLTGTLSAVHFAGGVLMDYGSPTVYLLSVGAFVLLLSLRIPLMGSVPAATKRSVFSMSLGIYLVHPMFLSALKRAPLDFRNLDPFFLIFTLWMVVFAASSATVYFLQRTPLLRRFV